MTIIFQSKKKTQETLTVFPEAVRGLRHCDNEWRLYVSDPDPMAVSVFRISPETLREGAVALDHGDNINKEKALTPENAEWLFNWLITHTGIRAELLAGDSQPAMFPLSRLAKPNPSFDRPAPKIN
jgi:hypothetical protein